MGMLRPGDTLMAPPQAEELAAEGRAKVPLRAALPHEDLSARFRWDKEGRDYQPQYASNYFSRLEQLRPACMATAARRFPGVPIAQHANALPQGPDVVLIATVVKDMKLRPSILKRIRKKAGPTLERYVQDTDWLEAEDNVGRCKLASMDVANLVTGVIGVFKGRFVTDTGILNVSDWDYPAPTTVSPPPPLPEPRYVCFVSGLELASEAPEQLALLRDFLLGAAGHDADRALAASIARVVVAGSAIGKDCVSKAALEDADLFFSVVARTVAVDVMPSFDDPSSALLPQRPLHPSFFPRARMLESFTSVPNPYHCKVGELEILGTSGEPVENMGAFSTLEDHDALKVCARARCLAPSAPDTMAIAPGPKIEKEPFIFDNPHVLFSGRGDAAAWDLLESGTLCVTVPSFAKCPTAVLVNVGDLRDVRTLEFA